MMTSQSETAVRAGEQRYRHLFDHMPVCIIIADVTATPAIILEANRRAELVYGYTAAEFAGMPAAYLIPEDARAAVRGIAQRVQQGQTVTAETTNQRRDCTRFPVRIVAAPDPTDARHMIVTVEDITAEVQRRSEAEAIDAERHRIAHEIHDGVAQSLAALRFKSALWRHLADAAPPGMRSALGESAGRDHPARQAGGHHATNREAIALVDVRHRQRLTDDAGQGCRIHELFQRAIFQGLFKDLAVGVKATGTRMSCRNVCGTSYKIVTDPLQVVACDRFHLSPPPAKGQADIDSNLFYMLVRLCLQLSPSTTTAASAAAASRGPPWVLDVETAACRAVYIVNAGAFHVAQALRVDDHA